MLNYLKVLLRTLRRERLYAAINVAGLSLGVASCLILGLYLRSELTYDQHFKNHERIFRVVMENGTSKSTDRAAVTSRQLGPTLAPDHPEVRAYVRFRPASWNDSSSVALRRGDVTYYWKSGYFADDNVFDVFTHDVVYGDPKTALKQAASIAVSSSFARKYFGDANPIGETLVNEAGMPLKITLVFADLPSNTHLKYDVLFSMNARGAPGPVNQVLRSQELWEANHYTYVLMAPGFDPADWQRINDEFYSQHMATIGTIANLKFRSWLQPLADIHFNSGLNYDQPNGNRLYLYACTAIALFILVVACINYMNLATARATRRARMVGIRKILGASRGSLALQFMGEALLFALLALIIGVALIEVVLALTPINELLGQQLSLDLLREPELAVWLLGLGLLMGLLSGSYPALYLSSWAPLSALTSTAVPGRGGLRLRELLVLLQFTISAGVIACTLLMGAQMRYIANMPLGFEKEQRLVVVLRGVSTIEKIPALRTELAKNSRILSVSKAEMMPGQAIPMGRMEVDDNEGAPGVLQVSRLPVTENFLETLGIKVVQGRDFSQRRLTDVGTSYVVNEAFVRKMGWTEPLGKRLQNGRVIGVVQDFNFKSLHTLVEPIAMFPLQDDFSQLPEMARPFQQRLLVLKIAPEEVGKTLAFVERVVRQFDPKHPFDYSFLDDSLDQLYKSERQLMQLVGTFSAICIFIACLGLFGLSAFTTEQRTHEIGTRKVLGATTWQIIKLLCRRITLLVAIASVIASVIAWFAIDEWLTSFAYRAGIDPLIFLLAAIAAAAVAFATVALQSFRTASADPVQSLRHV